MAIPFDALIAAAANTRFAVLRPAQAGVLRLYAAEAHAVSDIGIELPTGAGKTLIALLVLDYWRREGRRVAILTGNKTLARQVESEARDLNVPTVRFEGRGDQLPARDLRLYSRAQAIAVMNYWVYINQKPAVDPAEFLVLDDAQLAESALASLFSVRIGRYEHGALFDRAMALFAQYTESPVADDHVKGLGRGPVTPTDLVPFIDLLRMYDELEALVEAQLAAVGEVPDWTDLRFRWNRLRPRGRQTLTFLSGDDIVLRPYIYPTQAFPHLAAPIQRLYMSATLHDPDDLRRRLGTPPIVKIQIPSELKREEEGRRLFVFNQTASPSSRAMPGEEVLRPLLELLVQTRKSVWLCSTAQEARRWRAWLAGQLPADNKSPMWELTPTGDELDAFTVAADGHLFIAGRFEGMDFSDETCRLAVFPSLPRATGALERFVSEQLKDAGFQRTRMLERIKQGIGRCTRGNDDYAVYYFLDTRFYAEMESRAFGALQSERTRRQVEVGLELTQDGMGAVVPFARRFLEGDFGEFDEREAAVRPPTLSGGAETPVPATVSDEVDGWLSLFERRDFEGAAMRFERVSAQLGNAEREHRGFWKYLEALCEHLRERLDGQPGADQMCVAHLERAIREGGSSSWFNRLRRSLNQLRGEAAAGRRADQSALFDRWDEMVERFPHYKGRFLKWQAGLEAYLGGTHNQVCEALQTVGYLLGYQASRPAGDGVPDGVWRTGDHAVTLEAKIQVGRDRVSLADVNQANGHRRAMMAQAGLSEGSVGAVIVTPMADIEPSAAAAVGVVRIVPLELAGELRTRLEAIMRAYWKGWSREDAAGRERLREAASRRLPPHGWLMRAISVAKEPFIREGDLFSEWPR